MNSIDLKAVITPVVSQGWEQFATRHPMLAQAIDQQLLIEQCARSIRDDPEYREALRQTQEAGLQLQLVQDLVVQIARKMIRTL